MKVHVTQIFTFTTLFFSSDSIEHSIEVSLPLSDVKKIVMNSQSTRMIHE